MLAISNSEITTFDRCRREWYLRYYLGVAPAEPEITGYASLGTRVHAAMEGGYGYGLDPVAVTDLLYRLAIDKHPEHRTDLRTERDMAMTMVEGYLEWVAECGVDADLRVVATEREMQVPLPGLPGVMLRVRFDQVILNERTGLLSYLDFKTAANFERAELIANDPQMKNYSVAQRLMAADGGPLVDGGIIRTLRRVKRTARSKPPYYQDDRFRFNPEQLDAAQARITTLCAQIVKVRGYLDWAYRDQQGSLAAINEVQRSELPPSWVLRDCSWRCPFVNLCPMMDDGSNWPGVITGSGRYVQQDPYSYYSEDPLKDVRTILEGR